MVMSVRLKDIAERIGVSVTTVSLVLNNKPNKIPESTRTLIRNAAAEMNYRPNQIAISLKMKRTKTLGLIVPDIRNSFFSALARGIEERSRELGFTLLLCNTSDRHMRDIEYINMLTEKNVDGVLYCMSSDSNKEIFMESVNLLNANGLPFILVDRHFDMAGVMSITLDHQKGGYLATRHLLDLGHRTIACITGPTNLKDAEARLSGYKLALQEFGIEPHSELILEGNYDLNSGYQMTQALIARQTAFSALFACNDLMAYGAYKALREHGRTIPGDISIMGYDNSFLSDIFEVPLSTIHQPVEKLGIAATEQLIKLVADPNAEQSSVVFEPELIVRKSTAPFK